MTEEMSFHLEKFEGPLDLLLHLIEKNKINIYDIPIAEITDQYMAYMSALGRENLELMSGFLLMAATLLDIKARMLLPREVDEETGEELDPRAELVERLLEYKKYRLMAEELADREFDAARVLYREPSLPREVACWTPPVDLDQLFKDVTLLTLQKIFAQVMKQREDRIDPEHSRFGEIRKEPVSLKKRVGALMDYARTHRRFSFRNLLKRESSRTEIVVTFLAVLELMKIGKLRAVQEKLEDDIALEAEEGAFDEPVIDLTAVEEL
ncbi:MAG: segregation and condensation protein A [Stomatobaculum sp.]